MSTIKKQIVINADEYETRIATLENNTLVDLLMERPENQRMLGNIYKGKVKNVHKGMQAAFVDIGAGVDAFLHIGDTDELIQQQAPSAAPNLVNAIKGMVGLKTEQVEFKKVSGKERKMEEILKSDQEVLVQVIKEPIGSKGPRITTDLSIAGRYTVFVPYDDYVGISKKIEDKKERSRLRSVIDKIKDGTYGVIVRTEGEGKEEKDFAADIKELKHLWQGIERKAKIFKRPGVIFRDLGITLSFIRDSFTDEVDQIIIDSREVYKAVVSYLKRHSPSLINRVVLYKEEKPLFEKYEVEEELEKMLKRKVWFKGGGYLVIDRTEALYTIDVNSGRYGSNKDQHKSILETNLNAAREVARQLRLRDMGGLIVVDFIDMESRRDRKHIYFEMINQLKGDKAKSKILHIDDLGLLAMSRQRMRESIPYTLSESCPMCDGLGRVVSQDTLGIKIEREILKIKSEYKAIELAVHPFMKEFMTEETVHEWQKRYRLKIEVKVNNEFKYNQFEIKGVGLKTSRISLLFDNLFS